MEIRIFFDNENLEKIVSDYTETSQQYFEEEFSDYLETEGSYAITKEELLNNGLSYDDIPVRGFIIENIEDRYEIIPISIIDNLENTEVLYNLLIVVKLENYM